MKGGKSRFPTVVATALMLLQETAALLIYIKPITQGIFSLMFLLLFYFVPRLASFRGGDAKSLLPFAFGQRIKIHGNYENRVKFGTHFFSSIIVMYCYRYCFCIYVFAPSFHKIITHILLLLQEKRVALLFVEHDFFFYLVLTVSLCVCDNLLDKR